MVAAEFADLGRIGGDDRVAELVGLDWPAGSGPIVEIGAGTGYVTAALAAATEGEIWAVERDEARRAGLLARIVSGPGLPERITVVPGDFFTVALPQVWRAALAFHFLCQLDGEARQQFWKVTAQKLPPGAPLYVDRHYGPAAGQRIEEKVALEVRVGRHVYQRRFGAEPLSSGAILARNRYRVLAGDEVVQDVVAESTQWPYDEETAIADAAACGFTAAVASEHFLRFTTT